jgi:glycosyltransferase involved in cell wall biosynthesis
VNVGRLVPAKGQRTLLKAIEQIDDERVVLGIIGDGHLRDELEQQSKELRIREQVRFFGRLSRSQTLQYMSVADIFISNSTREGFGIAFLEAMALGLPTIVSDIPAHREVGDEDTSIFVPPKSPNRFARSLQQLSEDPERRDRLGNDGRESAKKIYDISNISEEYQSVYSKYETTGR